MKLLAIGMGLAGCLLAGTAGANSICDNTIGNKVLSCGFEAGSLSDWQHSTLPAPGGSATAAATTAQANSGSWSAELSATGAGEGKVPTSEASISQDLTTVVGQSYALVFYVMGASQRGNGGFEFDARDSLDITDISLDFGNKSGTFGWTEETFDFTAADTSLQLNFSAFATGRDNIADYYVDDVELVPQAVPEPGSLALMASALLAVAASFGLMKVASARRN